MLAWIGRKRVGPHSDDVHFETDMAGSAQLMEVPAIMQDIPCREDTARTRGGGPMSGLAAGDWEQAKRTSQP
jgi:hypothetical protein